MACPSLLSRKREHLERRDYAPGCVMLRNLRRLTGSTELLLRWKVELAEPPGTPRWLSNSQVCSEIMRMTASPEKQRERNDGPRVGREFPPRSTMRSPAPGVPI